MGHFTIGEISDNLAIGACFEVMRSLRPQLTQRQAFVDQVNGQRQVGYVLLAVRTADQMVVGAAGYRRLENLMHGTHLYVDDLVTLESFRRLGVGKLLMRTILSRAFELGCKKVLLDTGLENEPAHKFYRRLGFEVSAARFSKTIEGGHSERRP